LIKKIFSIIILILILTLPVSLEKSYALQEIAGKILVQLKSGEQHIFQWGLVSDTDSPIKIALSARGEGSQFLSFPNSVNLLPHKLLFINVTASIPSSYTAKSEVTPTLIAEQLGQQGGATVINVELTKIVTIDINGAQIVQSPTTGVASTPEFSSMSALILGMAITSMILFSAFTRKYEIFKM